MLIKFTRGTALGGVGNDAAPGEVYDLPDAAARALIQQGRAVAAPPPTRNEPIAAAPTAPAKPKPKAKTWTSSATAP